MGTPTPITISGTIRNGETTVAGRLVFASSTLVRDNASDDVMLPFEIVVDVPADGEFSRAIPATIDPGFSPSGWTIEVRPHFPHWVTPFSVSIPYDAPDGMLDFSELAPVPPDGDGDLYALLNHTHTIEQVSDLQTQLDGKLDVPVEPYITAEDVDHLISAEAVAEGYLPKSSPVVTDSTFTVVRSAGGAARWRATGGALDIEIVGDVIESSRPNQDFSGAQTDLRRLRAGSGNTMVGLTEFSSTAYTGEQAIDGANGVALLGAKNGATNLRLCGFLDINTAPTTGTWVAGDVVHTNIGPFRCSVGGTPGTWLPMWREQALDRGYVAWNGDPGAAVQAGTIIPTGGLSFIFRLRALGPLISKIQMHCSTTATGVTNAWCTLHDDNGLILNANAKSDANQNTAFNSGGMKNFTFIAPQVVTPGAFYRARVWFTTGTTLPTISRMCNSNTAIINPDITGTAATTAYGWASADSGLTDLASAPDQIGNLTGANTAWWMGAK